MSTHMLEFHSFFLIFCVILYLGKFATNSIGVILKVFFAHSGGLLLHKETFPWDVDLGRSC